MDIEEIKESLVKPVLAGDPIVGDPPDWVASKNALLWIIEQLEQTERVQVAHLEPV